MLQNIWLFLWCYLIFSNIWCNFSMGDWLPVLKSIKVKHAGFYYVFAFKYLKRCIFNIICTFQRQTWNLSKILHCRIFRLKILHRQFHLISTVLVRKNTKNEWKWRNLHRLEKFYTAAGTDGIDKFHLCSKYAICCKFALSNSDL